MKFMVWQSMDGPVTDSLYPGHGNSGHGWVFLAWLLLAGRCPLQNSGI